jgi:hypothetical protein
VSGFEYRIEYAIQRRPSGDRGAEFVDVGFGSSGSWDDVDVALYAVQSDVQNRMWETTDGMPEPGDA